MKQSLERIKKNIPYNHKLKIYTKEFIEKMVNYYEEIEEYENCHILLKFIEQRLNHEKNYDNR